MRRSWHLTFGNERGSIFLAGLVLVTILTFLGLALFDLARIEGVLVTQDVASTQALYQAEAALSTKIVELNDPLRRTALISSITGAAAGTTVTLTSDTVNVGGAGYARTVVSSDGPTSGEKYMTATLSPPTAGDTQRVLRVTLAFLAPTFQYAAVANNGDLILRGTGAVPGSGPGGADLVNGDMFVKGNVFLGTPGSPTDVKVNCLTVLSDCTDSRPTISQLLGTSDIVNNPQGDAAFPQNEALKTGLQPDIPTPDVPVYVSALKGAVGVTGSDPLAGGSMEGIYKGSPVYNLAAIFDPTLGLGANADGSLRSPSGCGCGGSPTGNCKLYCTLQPLGLKKNPSDRSVEVTGTPGDDYYFDGAYTGEQFASPKRVEKGAQRRINFNISSQPPIFLGDGNVRFSTYDSYGFAIDGRATMVATRDVILSDNMIYKGGNADTNPLTADLIGLVARQDIWFGDPQFGRQPGPLQDTGERRDAERHDAGQPPDRGVPRLREPDRQQRDLPRRDHGLPAGGLLQERHELRLGGRLLAIPRHGRRQARPGRRRQGHPRHLDSRVFRLRDRGGGLCGRHSEDHPLPDDDQLRDAAADELEPDPARVAHGRQRDLQQLLRLVRVPEPGVQLVPALRSPLTGGAWWGRGAQGALDGHRDDQERVSTIDAGWM
ncbi:MAG: hypothetical protein HYU42_14450 [Candidatus Rokubacteria bacterium]|nr:hypothetical protein [Candidatus Rokubacteria bacterium]